MDKEKAPNGEKNDQTKLLMFVAIGLAIATPFISTMVAVNTLSAKLDRIAVKAPASGTGETADKAGAEAKETTMVFYEPMEFLVNLADTESCHYLRTTVSLGTQSAVEDEKSANHGVSVEKMGTNPVPLFTKLKTQEPAVRDTIISVISTYSMTALTSNKGKNELKEMIRARLQQQLGTDNLAVFFTAFTLQ